MIRFWWIITFLGCFIQRTIIHWIIWIIYPFAYPAGIKAWVFPRIIFTQRIIHAIAFVGVLGILNTVRSHRKIKSLEIEFFKWVSISFWWPALILYFPILRTINKRLVSDDTWPDYIRSIKSVGLLFGCVTIEPFNTWYLVKLLFVLFCLVSFQEF